MSRANYPWVPYMLQVRPKYASRKLRQPHQPKFHIQIIMFIPLPGLSWLGFPKPLFQTPSPTPHGWRAGGRLSSAARRLRKLRPPCRVAAPAGRGARAPAPEQKRNAHQYRTVRRGKSSRMLMGAVKRPTCKVKGQIGASEACTRRR